MHVTWPALSTKIVWDVLSGFGLLYFSSIKPEWAMGNDDRVSFTNRRFMTGFHSQEEDFWVAFKQSGWGKRIYFLFFAKKNMF